tara:strand:- start:1473 stop:1808 length:336 start_codon:yes stop_codon:yes gene_type:complete
MNNEKYILLSKKTKDYLVKVIITNDHEFDAMKQDHNDFRDRVEAAERRLELVQKKVESLQVEKRQIQGRMNSVEEAILTIKTVHYPEGFVEGEPPRKTKERLFLDHLLRIL